MPWHLSRRSILPDKILAYLDDRYYHGPTTVPHNKNSPAIGSKSSTYTVKVKHRRRPITRDRNTWVLVLCQNIAAGKTLHMRDVDCRGRGRFAETSCKISLVAPADRAALQLWLLSEPARSARPAGNARRSPQGMKGVSVRRFDRCELGLILPIRPRLAVRGTRLWSLRSAP